MACTRWPWEAESLRIFGLGPNGWLRSLCCAAEEIPGGSAFLQNLTLNEDWKGHAAQNEQKPKARCLAEPAIPPKLFPLEALHLNDFQEERDREYTEVEIESDTMCYKGEWQGRMKHGEGRLKMPDGRIYEGQFVRDVAHGQGTLFMASGAFLECNWVQGKAEGFGHYEYNGNVYEGQWHQDEKSGSGTEHWPDGASYIGEFSRNLRHGLGTYTSNAGAVYEGEFREDKIDGSGKYIFTDGRVYQGEWVRGHLWGKGVLEWPNGFRYEGAFENDKRSGEGVATWPNGRAYRGQWLRGQQHGKGICVHPDGTQEETEWAHGRRCSSEPTSPRSSRGTPRRSKAAQWSPAPSVVSTYESSFSDFSHISPRSRKPSSPRLRGKKAPPVGLRDVEGLRCSSDTT